MIRPSFRHVASNQVRQPDRSDGAAHPAVGETRPDRIGEQQVLRTKHVTHCYFGRKQPFEESTEFSVGTATGCMSLRVVLRV